MNELKRYNMLLERNMNVKIFDVLANYKVKTDNAPYLAILKFALENKGVMYSELLHEELLKPLTEVACENLLIRLLDIGYFYKNEDDEYGNFFLTPLGEKLAEEEIFFEDRLGLLRLFIVENEEFVEQKVIKIEELERDTTNIDTKDNIDFPILKSIQNSEKIIELTDNSYIIENIEKFVKEDKPIIKVFNLNVRKNYSEAIIMDYAMKYGDKENETKELILINEYKEDYNKESKFLKVDYSKQDISLNRNIRIERPKIYDTKFKAIELTNISVTPTDINEARKWYFEIVKSKIDRYFLSDEEFINYTNEITKLFPEFKSQLKDTLSKDDFIEKLNSVSDFYIKAKLETVKYLNY